MISQFIGAQTVAPKELILDIDASDIPLHGAQEKSEFNAYYDHYCYLPLDVFRSKALACVLRNGRIDGTKHTAAVIQLLVTRLRQVWPMVRIIVRGDSGFCRQRLIRCCERSGVGYVIGVARNVRLHRIVATWEARMEKRYVKTKNKQRLIREFVYAADSWDRERRIVTRLEFGSQGTASRFIVTNLRRSAPALYDDLYCLRGEAENRIKETQLDLIGTRKFLANWLRILLSALAHTLMQRLREMDLGGTDAGLKERENDPVERQLDEANRRIGELVMEVEILQKERRARRPLVGRMSSR